MTTSLAAATVVVVGLAASVTVPTSADTLGASASGAVTRAGGPLLSGGIRMPRAAAAVGEAETAPTARSVDPTATPTAPSAIAAHAGAEPVKDQRPRPVARYGGLELRMPSISAIAAGFHEAATSNALPMRPHGQLLRNLNATRYEAPADVLGGITYLVMSSRERAAPATSALDVLMRDDDPVLSPVDGVVADVREVLIEQQHPDLRVELHPDDDDALRVVIVHVDGVRVAPGDRVEAGTTVLASTARRFAFLSQIDNLTYPQLWPHVHLEVQPRRARRPGDPPADADRADADQAANADRADADVD